MFEPQTHAAAFTPDRCASQRWAITFHHGSAGTTASYNRAGVPSLGPAALEWTLLDVLRVPGPPTDTQVDVSSREDPVYGGGGVSIHSWL